VCKLHGPNGGMVACMEGANRATLLLPRTGVFAFTPGQVCEFRIVGAADAPRVVFSKARPVTPRGRAPSAWASRARP
jgi:hypothetical protein